MYFHSINQLFLFTIVINLVTNKLVKIIGLTENGERFNVIALYQGKTRGVLGTTEFKADAEEDPTLICAAYKKHRFYLFSRREPSDALVSPVSYRCK